MKLTKEAIEEFENARNDLWEEEKAWWRAQKEILMRQEDLRNKFILAYDLDRGISIEQQIADWRWKNNHA
jgi:hypothetical protein